MMTYHTTTSSTRTSYIIDFQHKNKAGLYPMIPEAPLVRPRSPSPSNDRENNEIESDSEYEQEEEEPMLKSSSFVVLFLKCVLFSVLGTICILYCTNQEELTLLAKELQKSAFNSISIVSKETTSQKQTSDSSISENNAKDAIIYNLNIPSKCRRKDDQHSDECSQLIPMNIKDAFLKDGVIAIRGLLTPEEIDALDQSSLKLMNITSSPKSYKGPIKVIGDGGFKGGKQFFSSRHHAIFEPEMGFRTVALKSLLPQIASELMTAESKSSMEEDKTKLKSRTDSIRLIRDVFLAKDQDPFICGWHVDDAGFWPTTFPFQGINAWVAIDTIPIETGGGFALSVKSHTADWRFEAYKITGSTYTLPDGGYRDAKDMFDNRGEGTCNIKHAAPVLDQKIEESKRIYDVQRGDIILHTRWLFHRTVPIEYKFAKQLNKKKEKLLYRRYSLRYSPSNAILTSGYGTELSILNNPSLGGETLDTACDTDGPWYPKCWPTIDESELRNLDQMKEKIKTAERKKIDIMKEMKPFLQEVGRQQRESMLDNMKNSRDGIPSRKNGKRSTAKIMEMKNSAEL